MKMPRKLAKKPRSWSSIICDIKTEKLESLAEEFSVPQYHVKYLLNRFPTHTCQMTE
ncbi:hypothetical protein C1H46_012674 [Malus baccata]|uniref:Uncharacterized protein n=1 Tax=Malus baccata TaxID=106549 RepID=A0A540MTN6_MALBA|nr:hypothetical protein C1H46_012674 [Malus baccata]